MLKETELFFQEMLQKDLKLSTFLDADFTFLNERLARNGLLNDAEFARMWVENREAFRPASKRAIALELRRKGVADDEIKAAVAGTNDASAADKLAQAKAGRFAALPWPEFRLKLLGLLARRGFTYETAREATEKAWQTTTGGRPPLDD